MAWENKLDSRVAMRNGIFLAIAVLFFTYVIINSPNLSVSGRDMVCVVLIFLASVMAPLLFINLGKGSKNERKLAIQIIGIAMLTALGLSALIGLILPSMMSIVLYDGVGLMLVSLVCTAIVALLEVMAFTSVVEIVGRKRAEKMAKSIGSSRAEKMKLAAMRINKIWAQYKESKSAMFALWLLIIFFTMAIIGPAIALENPNDVKYGQGGGFVLPTGPDGQYWFGTDHQHKDILSQILYGSGTSLLVGFLAGAISLGLGTSIGLSAGYYGRAVDEVLMRITDFFLVIPWFPLMIVLVAILGKSLWIVILVIGITSWSPTARVVRASVLSIKEKQYIERSRALGGGNMHIISKHIMPNVFPLIVATSILLVAEAIFSEAFLDFFGLGDPRVVSWGWMLERAHATGAMLNFWWWWVLPPGIAIILLVMSFYLVGDALDEILNPRLKRR